MSNISIGKGECIQWVDFETSSDDVLEIDELLEPSWFFWRLLEINCVVDCCGIDAFCFWPEEISRTAKKFDSPSLNAELSNLRNEILKSNHRIIHSSKLNNRFDKGVFMKLLDHIIKCL